MIELTSVQQDALVELLNIGFERAGSSLSELTGHRVVLDVPDVSIHSFSALRPALRAMASDDIAGVHQIFSGSVAGDALLLLNQQAAGMLKQLLTDEAPLPLSMDASAREQVTEVGNVLLNACLGTFGNLLKVQVSFSVPRLTLDSLHHVLESLVINREQLRYALVVPAGLKLRDAEVRGVIVIVLNVASLDRLIHAVEAWEHGAQET
jgi:chemotaxis protein CheC